MAAAHRRHGSVDVVDAKLPKPTGVMIVTGFVGIGAVRHAWQEEAAYTASLRNLGRTFTETFPYDAYTKILDAVPNTLVALVTPEWASLAAAACDREEPLPPLQSHAVSVASIPVRSPSDSLSGPVSRTASYSLDLPTAPPRTASTRSDSVAPPPERGRGPESLNVGYLPVFFNVDELREMRRAEELDDDPARQSRFSCGQPPSWRPFDGADAVASERAPAVSPFLTEGQRRQADYIDRRRPFECQKEAGHAEFMNVVTQDAVPEAAGLPPRATPNQDLIDQLLRLKEVYRASGDKWREYAYNKALSQIKKLTRRIETADDVRSLPGVGGSILSKIEEILATGRSAKLEYLENTPEIAALETLTKVWGIGPSTARKLFQQGATGVESLRTVPTLRAQLSAAQLVGLKWYDDLLLRIPRAEVALVERVVCGALERLGFTPLHPDAEEQAVPTTVPPPSACGTPLSTATAAGSPAAASVATSMRVKGGSSKRTMSVMTCGSYRRGKNTSGDVDVLLCDRSGRYDEGVLQLLVNEIVPKASQPRPCFDIVDKLTHGARSHEETHHDTWFGVVRIAPCVAEGSSAPAADCPCEHREDGSHIARRLDVKLYPAAHYPFAVLYFTGSDYFNRSMRLYAQKKGMSLSDKELVPVIRVHGDKVHEGAAIPCATERDIFAALGLPYKAPRQRDVS
jgi:DNA polymerase/3'-5' exonuclease PolX